MSYCVNCGVELDDSAKECPLCHVAVINPEKPWKGPALGPYPNRVEKIFKHIDRRYGAALASILLAIPVICSVLIDILITHRLSWSGYVSGGVICVFVFFLLPLLVPRPNVYFQLLYNTAAAQIYLAAIFYVNESMASYLNFAMPLCFAASALAYLSAATIRMKALRGRLYKPAVLVILLALFLIAVELIVDLNVGGVFKPFWSLITAVPCLVTSVVLVLLEGKRGVKDRIIRRLFM